MKQIYFLSAFFPSFAGGAEKSILEEFKLYTTKGYGITGLTFDNLFKSNSYDFGCIQGKNFHLSFSFLLRHSRLAYLFFNRSRVNRILEKEKQNIKQAEFVILQGLYTPYIAKWCFNNGIKYHYYLRDGASINFFLNQARGLRRLRKYLKLFIEMPFIIDFRVGNRNALKRASKIIANSDKMAELLFQRFDLKATEVVYPKVCINKITNFVLDSAKQEFITLIGGRDSDKAYEIFLRTAKKMPEHEFMVVEKRNGSYKKGNITFAPRQDDVRKIYEKTKVAISISRWNNAFSGRVGMEAGRLGIPVISSSSIPDAQVDSRKIYILKDIDDVDEWIEAIRSFETKRGIFIFNSDFGVRNTIGARAHQIWKRLTYKNGVNVFCRNYRRSTLPSSLVKKVVPGGAVLMKFINALHIYFPLVNRIDLNKLKVDIFQYFLLKKLKKVNLRNIDFVHSWDFLPKTYAWLKKNNPQIKIFQDVPMAFSSILERVLKTEEVYDKIDLSIPAYIKETFKYVDKYIVPSAFVKDSLLNENIDQNKIAVVPFGVDATVFQPKEKVQDEIFRVAFSGAVNNRKGASYLVEAWKQLKLEKAELHLYGRVYPEAFAYLSELKENSIFIHGFVNIVEELPKNDIFVFPSLLEGSSKAVYEALACGLPVVTTYNAGSIIKDGVEGFIVPTQDVNSLKNKILFFYQNREAVMEFGQRARKLALEYSWQKYGKQVAKEYINL